MFYRNEIPGTQTATPARISYPWWKMEEYQPDGGMWQIPPQSQRAALIDAAERLMLDCPAFIEAMARALREWPRSVSVAFTTPGLNKRAWIGHAGCWLATGSPEETTRIAWHRLDDGEQFAANDAAQSVIASWQRPKPDTDEPSFRLFEEDGAWDA